MTVKFIRPRHNRLSRRLKDGICECVLKKLTAYNSYRFYIHFDLMLYGKRLFRGYADTWIGYRDHKQTNRRRKNFTVMVKSLNEKERMEYYAG